MKTSRIIAMACLWSLSLSACGGELDRLWYYRVDRTSIEECSIRPDGEFCKPEDQYEVDANEGWAIHLYGREAVVYLDEIAWRMDPIAADADPLTAARSGSRLVQETRQPGPCTTTTEALLRLSITEERIAGELRTRQVLEGAESCGATPLGERIVKDITGLKDLP
jgi:hypothetical protein